jgi:hypothetical protein
LGDSRAELGKRENLFVQPPRLIGQYGAKAVQTSPVHVMAMLPQCYGIVKWVLGEHSGPKFVVRTRFFLRATNRRSVVEQFGHDVIPAERGGGQDLSSHRAVPPPGDNGGATASLPGIYPISFCQALFGLPDIGDN